MVGSTPTRFRHIRFVSNGLAIAAWPEVGNKPRLTVGSQELQTCGTDDKPIPVCAIGFHWLLMTSLAGTMHMYALAARVAAGQSVL